jgi:hypothetical protein
MRVSQVRLSYVSKATGDALLRRRRVQPRDAIGALLQLRQAVADSRVDPLGAVERRDND